MKDATRAPSLRMAMIPATYGTQQVMTPRATTASQNGTSKPW